jgi:hypothetical protein
MASALDRFMAKSVETMSLEATRPSSRSPFVDVVKNSKDTDKQLGNLQNELFDSLLGSGVQSFSLPKLGVNDTQDRLNFNGDEGVYMLFRDVTRTLFSTVNKQISKCYYVSGSQGIGKTHALYTSACLFRLLRVYKIRVTYIQSCRSWVVSHIDEQYQFILNELCETFQDDLISGIEDFRTIDKWAEWVMDARPMNGERDGRFATLKEVLNSFVSNEKIRWISIFDQENGLYKSNHSKANVYPFESIEGFSQQVSLH